ncbi:MAG: FliM/FliN family flagellar motor switch protein [Candidatus Schekmanbacteria bacterium]|nr:FliM/FliN family flagellar motor switch protein [Candidatus Schekmanbacteria bacterium]
MTTDTAQSKKIRPLTLQSLPKVDAQQARLVESLTGIVPLSLFKEDFFGRLASLLHKFGLDEARDEVATIEVVSRDEQRATPSGTMFALGETPMVIGRHADNTLQLADKAVSGRHAKIYAQDGRYYAVDLRSTNGTLVNGRRLLPETPEALRDGDMILVECYELRFSVRSEASHQLRQRIRLRRVETCGTAAFLKAVPKGGQVARVLMIPTNHECLVEVDSELATFLVSSFLGGTEARDQAAVGLSELERGVLEFVFLKVLHLLHEEWGDRPRVHLRLHGLIDARTLLSEREIPAAETGVLLSLDWSIGANGGYVHVFLPQPAILEGFLPDPDSIKDMSAREIALLRERLIPWASYRTRMWAELGRLELNEAEINGLRLGDVVLIDDLGLRLVEGELRGPVILRVNYRPGAGGLRAVIVKEGRTIQLRVEEIIRGEDTHMGVREGQDATQEHIGPVLGPDGPGGGGQEADNLDQAYPMLSDVYVPVKIVIGQAIMTMKDLMKIRPGQIIELNKIPGEPVDLAVEGRTVAKGELVDVEGKLGVRVLNLFR